MQIPENAFVLVDGSSFLYRAFYAMPSLSNSANEPTGAVYGVINMLRRTLAELKPEHIAVVFDAKGKTFRDDIYADYKANRPPMPPELRAQVPAIHSIIEALGLPLLVIDGVEADDVIGTLARQAQQDGRSTVIVTGDKDMAQLVDGTTVMFNSMNDEWLDEAGVKNKFGVAPRQIIDYLALIGDTSDNIPGVPKCGPKTAVKWLDKYGSLAHLVENVDDIGGKIGESLRGAVDFLPTAQRLVTIKCDVPLGQTVQALKPGARDEETLKQWYSRLEFKTWLGELLSGDEGDDNDSGIDVSSYQLITTERALDAWLVHLAKQAVFAFDTETTSLQAVEAELVGISCASVDGQSVYIPLMHEDPELECQLARDVVLERLKPLLLDSSIGKIGHNLKYDLMVLANYDVTVEGPLYDTMLESYVLNSTASRHDLDTLSLKYLSHKTISFEEVAGKGKKQVTFDKVPIVQAGPYAAEDALVTLKLHQMLWPKIEEAPVICELFRTIEMPLVKVLAHVEYEGVQIDANLLKEQSLELADALLKLEQEIYQQAEVTFNLDSPKQLQEVLYEKLKLPVLKKTPKGQPSTAEPVLQELALDFPIARAMIEYRGLNKLKQTYTDKLPEMICQKTGRVHTSYHQAVTATGRLSSSDPNLQNIPVRSGEGRRIRQAFIAPPGQVIVAADYSQIELRIMAHLSGDTGLVEAFKAGKDIHRATAAEVFGVGLDAVSDDQRRSAKAINFGLIYGMSAFGLAKQLKTGRKEAQMYIDLYFERYPGVREYMEKTQQVATEQGFVETLFGRRLYLPDARATNKMRQQAALRTAINAPMQGTAADIIKRAMIAIDAWLCESSVPAKMIMQVHDELVFEVEASFVEQFRRDVVPFMVDAAQLDVPLVVDVGEGPHWEAAH